MDTLGIHMSRINTLYRGVQEIVAQRGLVRAKRGADCSVYFSGSPCAKTNYTGFVLPHHKNAVHRYLYSTGNG